MRAQITLVPSESKRLIARGVAALPSVKNALQNHTIIISGGTTNGFIVEELLGITIERKSTYTIGIVTAGETGISDDKNRIPPFVITKGIAKPGDYHWKEYLECIGPGDIFIKGGNAVDHTGLAAVLASGNTAGTVGTAWGPVMQRGVNLIVPIGLEKLVPDVREAVEFMAGNPAEKALGHRVALMPMLGATVITEIKALAVLYGVTAKCIASGGVNGSEGAVVLVMDGPFENIKKAFDYITSIKGEPGVL